MDSPTEFFKGAYFGRKFPVRRSSSKIQVLKPYWETQKTSEVEEWGETHPSFNLMSPIEGGLLNLLVVYVISFISMIKKKHFFVVFCDEILSFLVVINP